MCGIAGFTRFNNTTGDLSTLKAMGQAIYHRGPDAGGEHLDDEVGLCHRRLSILDLSAAGNQPMYSSDDSLVIVFNGEIYNFLELREELVAKGYVFKTGTDTEVLLALYQSEGEKLLDKINGMFAFALWDKARQKLFIARDRLGKKPLYYYRSDDQFIFASELKAILTIPSVPRVIRPDAVCDFFNYQYVPEPKSIFEDIFKLEPGHYLTISPAGIENKQYWNLTFASQQNANEQQIKQELLAKLTHCTKQRMISDVPLGAFLSGGVDSSGIVALMSQQSEKPVTTCTIGFDSEKFDEVDFARKIAEQYQTDHHEFKVQQNVADNLEKIVAFFDEPFGDPSLVPTYFVSKLARSKVTVALAGDGGDECFAGYSKYAVDAIENKIRQKIPKVIRESIFPSLAKLIGHKAPSPLRKAKSLLTTLSHSPEYGFFISNCFFRQGLWNSLITNEFKASLNGYDPAKITLDAYNQCDGKDHLSKILYTDFKTYLPGDILVKVDRMSMANSLEVRAPILDYQIVEYAASVPSELKLNGQEKKHILKLAFSDLLSQETLYRKKMGFSVPLADWLRNELRSKAESVLFNASTGLCDYFDMQQVKSLWDDHLNKSADNSTELWSMLVFQLWFNEYAEQ